MECDICANRVSHFEGMIAPFIDHRSIFLSLLITSKIYFHFADDIEQKRNSQALHKRLVFP